MTFLNMVLLGGMAAGAIPIIIYLINRSRYRIVKWGAMHLLDSAYLKNTRRLRWEQLLLLLLRCAIPVILALCMARPVLTKMASLVGSAKTSMVVLLDNSYSMEYGGAANGNFAQAKAAAAKVVQDLGRGSDISVVMMAGGVAPLYDVPTFDLNRVEKDLAGIDAGFGKATVPDALDTGAGIIAKMQHPYREIVVISDFQRISWSDEEAPARSRAAELLKKMPFPPQVTLFHVGAEGRENVSVESLDYTKLVLGVRQPLQVRANLRNYGDREYPELRVYFKVDGAERSAAQISLGAHERQQVLFSHTFDTAGSHVIQVYTEADTLKADNSLEASIPVWDKVPVLLVNGAPSSEPLKGETDFLEIALQPFGIAKADLTDLITTRVVDERELRSEDIPKNRVIVLANVRQLSDRQLKALRDFVSDGGGLLIFPGDHINTEWYNKVLANESGLLPTPLATLAGSLDDAAPHTKIVSQTFTHPALEMFNDPRNGTLSDAEIKLWYKMAERPTDATVSVLGRLDTGDPFLIEKKVGEGRVILCATPCDADWSNLPVRPFYLPLMQRLVTYLASSVYPPRNVDVGKPLNGFYSKNDIGKKVIVTDSAGHRQDVAIVGKGSRGYVEYTATKRPGLYLITAPDGTVTHYVVSTSREESNLEQLSESQRAALAASMGAKMVNSLKEYEELDRNRRFGREIWRPLLWTVLALIFAELLLEQWFGRRRA